MRVPILAVAITVSLSIQPARMVSAYDMDCAIILCLAGGFPASAVCTAAHAEMIRRITPWPSLPPFGICTFAALPLAQGGSGGLDELDTTAPEFVWLRQSRMLWFNGRYHDSPDDPLLWEWSVQSCDHENTNCHFIVRVQKSRTPWPKSFVSENGQTLDFPRGGDVSVHYRAVMFEYGDYQGTMNHSDWILY